MIRPYIIIAAAVLLLAGCGAENSKASGAAVDDPAKTESSSMKEENSTSAENYTEVTADIDPDTAEVSYLGPEGTYTQEACGVFFGGKGSYVPYETVSDAVDALVKGESSFAVIPQENTIGGAVTDYVDILISTEEVSVVGEVELSINQNLLVLPDTELSDIKTVYSHKQGIAQGKEWLEANLPDAEVIEVSSTAEGAKMVAEGSDKSCAAIASAACADVYGLEVEAAAIQNNDSNKTRFYVLTTQPAPNAPAERTAFIAEGSAGSLPKLLGELEEQDITLVALHDRPRKTELGEYDYVIECENCPYEKYLVLENTTDLDLRFLGCFDAA
ncbi:prephenate dehydratase domain-containing protein [Ruminococcus sp.]|uniref:prephenate dehydratase n=1 Tax=Ruminococcus sp. TaxID=41978 RepID=UPI0025E84AFC|nr:prephenate dehydratase domain-containing protein [Ruminococcus sp.]MBQ8967100.1 hypothetical protein [Ruminococcus sp.]